MFTFPGWNSVEDASHYAKLFTYLGFASLFLLGVFEVLAHVYSTRKDTLAAAQNAAAKAADEQRIRGLQAKVGEQQQTLERRRDRTLTEEQAQQLCNSMRPFVGQHFWLITETADYDQGSEQMRFSDQLSRILTAAGWIRDQYPLADRKRPLPLYRRVTTSGVEIGYARGKSDQLNAAHALASGLTALHIDSTVSAFSDVSTALVINVGLR